MNQYKVGDKVKIIYTDFPTNVPVGSINEVTVVNSNSIEIFNGKSDGWTFNLHEVELYKEEMNNKIEVGDVLDTTGTSIGSSHDEVISIKANDLVLSVTGLWLLNNSQVRVDTGKWSIKSKAKKEEMNLPMKITKENISQVEVGDTVEYRHGGSYVVHSLNGRGGFRATNGQTGSNLTNFTLTAKAKMKEIIGYKLKDKTYEKAALALIDEGSFRDNTGRGLDIQMPKNIKIYKDLGVLDLWFEPVYKSAEVVVQLSNNRKATVVSKTIANINLAGYIGDIKAKDVEDTLAVFSNLPRIATYKVTIKEFQLGCQTFTHEDLTKLANAFKTFN